MPKPEWGKKRQCMSCGTKFYDMQRAQIVCPACGTEHDATETTSRARRSRSARTPAREATKAPAAEVAPEPAESTETEVGSDQETYADPADPAETVESGGEEETYDMIEDVSELGEDEDFGDVAGEDEEDDGR